MDRADGRSGKGPAPACAAIGHCAATPAALCLMRPSVGLCCGAGDDRRPVAAGTSAAFAFWAVSMFGASHIVSLARRKLAESGRCKPWEPPVPSPSSNYSILFFAFEKWNVEGTHRHLATAGPPDRHYCMYRMLQHRAERQPLRLLVPSISEDAFPSRRTTRPRAATRHQNNRPQHVSVSTLRDQHAGMRHTPSRPRCSCSCRGCTAGRWRRAILGRQPEGSVGSPLAFATGQAR